jgi:hypothetical protein
VLEFFVLFSLATTGSLVSLAADLALRLIARKTQNEALTTSPGRGGADSPVIDVDPVVTFGFTLAGYGIVALSLVSLLPGPFALERTALAFALLCVGGLISEISTTGTTAQLQNLDLQPEQPPQRDPISPGLSLALTLVLNLTFAVLSSGQGLLEIVPQKDQPTDNAITSVPLPRGEPQRR